MAFVPLFMTCLTIDVHDHPMFRHLETRRPKKILMKQANTSTNTTTNIHAYAYLGAFTKRAYASLSFPWDRVVDVQQTKVWGVDIRQYRFRSDRGWVGWWDATPSRLACASGLRCFHSVCTRLIVSFYCCCFYIRSYSPRDD